MKFFMRAWLAADVFAIVAGKIGETTSRGAVPATPELAHDSQLMATPEHFRCPSGGIGRHIKQNGFLLTKETIMKFSEAIFHNGPQMKRPYHIYAGRII